MASYKNRVKELEAALAAIQDLSTTVSGLNMDARQACGKVHKIAQTMLRGGVLSDSGVTKTVRNLMSGKEIEIPVGTPLCCDPSSETYWSM